MKPLVAGLAALVLALALGLGAPADVADADPVGGAIPQHAVPAAPSKTTKPKPRPSATPTPTPTVVAAAPSVRTAAEEEGERWVQLALVAGGGLLGAVALFFAIGALLRRRPKPRS